jgi:uncharacterized coiled-coil DUF342 family protein
MKKIMTFAVLAFLMGGLAINVNAQDKKPVKKTKTQVETTQNTSEKAPKVQEDFDQLIKDYSNNVTNYINEYKKFTSGDNASGKNMCEKYKQAALKIEAKIDPSKDKLDDSQKKIYEKSYKEFHKALMQK